MLINRNNMWKLQRLSGASIAELILVCLVLNLLALQGHFHVFDERSDGGTFYIGAQLLGTPQLYDIDAILYAQVVHGDRTPNIGLIYCRPPFVALLFKPLSFLEFYSAIMVWRLICAV